MAWIIDAKHKPLMKECTKCHRMLAMEDYRNKKRGMFGKNASCRKCEARQAREYRKDKQVKKQLAQYSKEYSKRPIYKKVRLKTRLKAMYNMTYNEYEEMLKEQNGACAICGNDEIVFDRLGRPQRLSVDHDHKTGKVRGLLCVNCNRGISAFKENEKLFENAVKYLKERS